jgi:localization factor PodJL
LETGAAASSVMRHTLSSAVPDNETAQSGAFDHRQTGRTPEISEPSVADAFHAIERIESRLSQVAPGVASTAPAGIEDTLRGFESRISTLTERLSSGTRPIGRRGVSHEDDLKSAVAQIRSRQADLDQGGARPQPSAPTADRSHGDILLALRGDMARLSGQIEATRGPERVAIEQLNREVASLRGSIGSLASRADVGQIEQSVAALSSQVAQARLSGGGLAEASAQFKTLQATIQRLTEMQASRDDGRVSRQIEQLSTKLDGMTAGAAPGLRDALVGQLHDIRAMMADAAPAAQIATLSHHVSALRDEIATLAARQVDPQEFAALKNSVDDMRRLVPGNGEMRPASGTADLASGLKPVEVLLHALVDKLDSVERQVGSRSVADPDSLDSLERQIATLATRLSETTGRDPSVAHLEQAMSQLMREISTWREDAVAAADKAARNVIAETLATGAPVALDTHLGRDVADLKQRYEATEKRTEASLVAVNRTLEDVAARIATLGGQSAPREAEQHSPASEVPVQVATAAESCEPSLAEGAALKRLTDAIVADQARHEPPLGHGTAPAVTPAEDEILLEPGSARPPVTAGRKAAPDVDAADIKTSFIAAARRAAQAAADDATTARRRMPATREAAGSESGAASSDLMGRLRAMVDRRRRPLLLSAAAVVLAIGTFQIARERIENDAPAPVATAQFPAGLLPELAEANRLARDPVTTASITPAEPVQASAQRADLPAVPAQNSAPAASQAAAAAPTLPGKPAAPPANAPEPGVTPAALKQAAQAGNPVAAYEFGARAAEGRGMPRDLQVAARFFEKAAEKGLAAAQYRTGNIYEKGLGVARDVEAAKAWYRKAAENGNTRAMHNLAVLLAEGAAGKPDYQSAIGWFERAAEQGMRDSQFNLAVLLARGLGTTQNLPQSYTWFAVAAAGGDDDAAKKRDEVGSRLPAPDLARAKLAAEHWRVTPPNAAANEVHLPANGFVESAQTTAAAAKKPAREGRV